MAEAVQALGEAFVDGPPPLVNSAGSPTLAAQLREGAAADVVIVADEQTMNDLLRDGLVTSTVSVARNRLVIVARADLDTPVRTLADLQRPGLLVSLADAEVPAGRYARAAFASAGLPVPDGPREPNVRAVLQRVRGGEADAGLVYATDVRSADDVVVVDLPVTQSGRIRHYGAVVEGTRNAKQARDFLRYVRSGGGQKVLQRFGFVTAPELPGS